MVNNGFLMQHLHVCLLTQTEVKVVQLWKYFIYKSRLLTIHIGTFPTGGCVTNLWNRLYTQFVVMQNCKTEKNQMTEVWNPVCVNFIINKFLHIRCIFGQYVMTQTLTFILFLKHNCNNGYRGSYQNKCHCWYGSLGTNIKMCEMAAAVII